VLCNSLFFTNDKKTNPLPKNMVPQVENFPPIPNCGVQMTHALHEVGAKMVVAAPDIRVKLRKADFPLKKGPEELVQVGWLEAAVDNMECNTCFLQAITDLVQCSPPIQELEIVLDSPLQSHIPQDVVFPENIPKCNVSPSNLGTPYGLSEVPNEIKEQITRYSNWCTTPIQLSRTFQYAQPVQSSTMHTSVQGICGYLGFLSLKENVATNGLYSYWNPDHFARFVSFLLARGVGRGQVLKHISIAKKVSSFLRTVVTLDKDKVHGSKVEEWLSILERQVNVVMPRTVRDANALPRSDRVREWVEYLKEVAEEAVAQDHAVGRRSITFKTAKMVSKTMHNAQQCQPIYMSITKINPTKNNWLIPSTSTHMHFPSLICRCKVHS
jgi:hypothetical protein